MTAATRRAAIKLSSNVLVSVKETVEWVKSTPGLRGVKDILDTYPVVLTDDFLSGRAVRSKRERILRSD